MMAAADDYPPKHLDSQQWEIHKAMLDEIDQLRSDVKPWSFIIDGNLDYANHEDHDFGVFIGSLYWCAGCLAKPSSYFTESDVAGWPNLVSAPNGLRLFIRPWNDTFDIFRRPLCPRRVHPKRWVDEWGADAAQYYSNEPNWQADDVAPSYSETDE